MTISSVRILSNHSVTWDNAFVGEKEDHKKGNECYTANHNVIQEGARIESTLGDERARDNGLQFIMLNAVGSQLDTKAACMIQKSY